MKNKPNIFFLLTIGCILLLILLKIFANQQYTMKNTSTQNLKSIKLYSSVTHATQTSQVQNFIKVWQFLYSFRDNKTLAYELKRKLEKQDIMKIITDYQTLSNIFKSLNYDENQKKMINEMFKNEKEFVDSITQFYLYLIISQFNESKINDLKKQKEYIKSKIYRIDPGLIERIKQKNDPELNKILSEIDKQLYQPNLSERKIKVLLAEMEKIETIINAYEQRKDDEMFKWMIENREKVLKSLIVRR
ncbi:MAG: hypothetical protein ABDH21_01120 [bacterium]